MSRVWHSGAPPHVGWWNASLDKKDDVWRWWDGSNWSVCAYDFELEWVAGRRAELQMYAAADLVEWTDFYPKNARGPRVNPYSKAPPNNEN